MKKIMTTPYYGSKKKTRLKTDKGKELEMEAVGIDVLNKYFSELTEPRMESKIEHKLPDIIPLTVLCVSFIYSRLICTASVLSVANFVFLLNKV